jgi:hypothetical protein
VEPHEPHDGRALRLSGQLQRVADTPEVQRIGSARAPQMAALFIVLRSLTREVVGPYRSAAILPMTWTPGSTPGPLGRGCGCELPILTMRVLASRAYSVSVPVEPASRLHTWFVGQAAGCLQSRSCRRFDAFRAAA